MNDTAAHVVIVGAGHAGGSAAAFLRQFGWKGPITLIGAEPVMPYQRPPLSKSWLSGDSDLEKLLLRTADFYRTNAIEWRGNTTVVAIERADRSVTLADGERLRYDQLILALGSIVRTLPVPGHDLRNVLALRTIADADGLKALLSPGLRLAIVGAGYIGLEIAASARTLGADVVVIEREARVLPRVASEPLSAFFQRRHAASGVRIMLNASVEAFEGDTHITGVRLQDGTVVACDAALIGVGAAPNDAVARAAGLACAHGIVVDQAAATSDPLIHAIGDCTFRPLPLYRQNARLESVPNALEQAKQAAATLCGRALPAPEVPWFWSDQYDVRLQIAGLPYDVADLVIRGDLSGDAFAIFHLSVDGTVQSVEAVNAPAEFMAGRLMIARRKRLLAAQLRDVSSSLKELAG
ncbi:MAG TPA: FAD-dependent oxidoreductase [Acetobacteraceae bacterium]|nr:FAD-dependent oxidoreductase [Acetobacteraceae bacterium]